MDVPVGQEIFPFIQNTSTQVIAIVGMVTVEVS
jgi:hypothetical protein